MKITQAPSPNFNQRTGHLLRAVILHDTGGSTLEGAVTWCQNKKSKVSYHYIVDLDGSVVQLVEEADRAWHAGKAGYPNEKISDVNDTSIGVAMVNDGAKSYPNAQVKATAELTADIMDRYEPPILSVYSHALVARPAGRKDDPHALFPWDAFNAMVQHASKNPPPPPISDKPLLKFGSNGSEVKQLQEALNKLIWWEDPLVVDGKFGRATENLLHEFMYSSGLSTVKVETTLEVWEELEKALGRFRTWS